MKVWKNSMRPNSGESNLGQYGLIAIAAAIIQFFIFKLFYPFCDLFADSFGYLEVAKYHYPIDYRPIGYSRILEILRFFSHSDTLVVAFQYGLFELSAFFFLAVLKRIFILNKKTSILLFVCLLCNPVSLFLCNEISSDAIFAAISILWLGTLLLLFQNCTTSRIVAHCLLLVVLFTFRYTAFFYPVISCVAFYLCRAPFLKKMISCTVTIMTLLGTIQMDRREVKVFSGADTFSGFSGWQVANNAMYMRVHLTRKSTVFKRPEANEIDSIAQRLFDNPKYEGRFIVVDGFSYFMWDTLSPLNEYRSLFVGTYDSSQKYLKVWTRLGPRFADYGWTLIRAHPLMYIHYYLCPNSILYLIPPVGMIRLYNEDQLAVPAIAADWFKFESPHLTAISVTFQGNLIGVFSLIFLFSNLALVYLYGRHFFSPRVMSQEAKKSLLLIFLFWVINFAFSVFTSPIEFRYEFFPSVLYISMALILGGIYWVEPAQINTNISCSSTPKSNTEL